MKCKTALNIAVILGNDKVITRLRQGMKTQLSQRNIQNCLHKTRVRSTPSLPQQILYTRSCKYWGFIKMLSSGRSLNSGKKNPNIQGKNIQQFSVHLQGNINEYYCVINSKVRNLGYVTKEYECTEPEVEKQNFVVATQSCENFYNQGTKYTAELSFLRGGYYIISINREGITDAVVYVRVYSSRGVKAGKVFEPMVKYDSFKKINQVFAGDKDLMPFTRITISRSNTKEMDCDNSNRKRSANDDANPNPKKRPNLQVPQIISLV
mmetsp:Transcript_2977/g.3341  ORF Transcript_2977/g.3341 Transcript_2977/m.3341 type:complete len:265 (-) Transcript_2977:17-811(-)